ncbi:MAG: tRNA (adenosine(37)-N6)-threonylcarbamoyltransferase complex dimerization subunit type 1 TsaB [Desulfobacterales bacterium]|nr:tRNA (adenosine(37)-N6)-threonylcarbamoyltransferase complex dimerization subunit type 1 TsaB [Desulfobacterales bacterium]
MKILALDTATKSCSVAICEDTMLLAEINTATGRTHSKHLMEMVDLTFRMAGVGLSDIDGFTVTRGPGSFTGLRIGLSTVKGLAAGMGKPVVAVSSLDVLAFQAAVHGYTICPLLDARKGEVYGASYRFDERGLQKVTDELVFSPTDFKLDTTTPSLFVGDGAKVYKDMIKDLYHDNALFVPESQGRIHAATVALLGLERFNAGSDQEVGAIIPQYIRKSDAELNLGKKLLK